VIVVPTQGPESFQKWILSGHSGSRQRPSFQQVSQLGRERHVKDSGGFSACAAVTASAPCPPPQQKFANVRVATECGKVQGCGVKVVGLVNRVVQDLHQVPNAVEIAHAARQMQRVGIVAGVIIVVLIFVF
jgi:hypothetical protein